MTEGLESRIPNPESHPSALLEEIQRRAPLTVAAFMDLALYHPEFGYYARSVQRSGRAGDFFTNVDVGPLFGALLAEQFAEMFDILEARGPELEARGPGGTIGPMRPTRAPNRESRIPNPESHPGFDLVEAGAGNGRLSADVLRALRDRHPALTGRIALHLVDASAAARAAQTATVGELAGLPVSSAPDLPESFTGVLFANELVDAMPVHQVVMRKGGLREVFIVARPAQGRVPGPQGPALQLVEAEPSTPALAAYLEAAGVTLDVGARAEIGLAAVDWVRTAARRLARGFLVLIDYGHEARELYSAAHAAGTLTSFTRHTMAGPDAAQSAWLANPGGQDITAHVDFTSIRVAAEAEGCVTLGFMDQTYFLMGILEGSTGSIGSTGSTGSTGSLALGPHDARALKTLIMPGGLGSTMKVLVLGKHVGTPMLQGCASRMRVT